MKNVLLVHGFNGIPKIFEYFKRELEKENYNVILPEFPVREEITVERYFEIFDKYSVLIKNIGHMGKKSGLEKLPEVIDIIKK